MNSSSLKFIQLSLMCLTLGACASHPKQDMQSAQRERERKEAHLAEKQADLNQDQAEDRAELQRKQRDDQAELRADKVETRAESDKEVHQAYDEMVEERKTFVAKQQQRIREAEAKADELLTKSHALAAGKKSKFNDAWRVYQTKHDYAQSQVRADQAASNANWAKVKPETEKSVDELESSVNELKKTI